MNTNPRAKTVLCYGDSNTWGTVDDRETTGSGRLAADMRWTGRLQQALGSDYYVIEEGMSGRTTNLEHLDASRSFGNGFTYFEGALESHYPLDYVLIMLGTNDLKIPYARPIEAVADALEAYVQLVAKELPQTKVLLIAPAPITASAPQFAAYYAQTFDAVSITKSQELPKAIQAVAAKSGSLFFDAGTVAHSGKDGVHFTVESHMNLGYALATFLKTK